ncbi:cytochrome P450 [Streptomyces sp. NPDC020681]|uniref:cytochrome P450 n=1 Tax=Streptomyces sp. NPDC020681 TaxID=3365083 RepID=UPI0037981996
MDAVMSEAVRPSPPVDGLQLPVDGLRPSVEGVPPAADRVSAPARPPVADPRTAPGLLAGAREQDRYRFYRWLREEHPLSYDPDIGAWLLSRHRDVAAALADPRFTQGHRPGDAACAGHRGGVPQALRDVVARTSSVLARRIARRQQADLVEEFCRLLPTGALGVCGRRAGVVALAGRCVAQLSLRERALASFLANVLDHPDQLAALRACPGLIGRAWAESLRRDPPVLVALRRTAIEVRVSGGTIPAGAAVACLIGAAGRDPERFREPDRFDPMRDDPGQLTFGPRECPAVRLAALEAEYGLRALFDAMPRLRWADGFRPVAAGLVTRAPRSLLVRPGG